MADSEETTIHLSIIVPFYNSHQKSTRLLQSLSRLTHPSVEVICVDDGSEDGTAVMLHEFSRTSTVDATVLVQSNKGPGGARNTGLRHSRGEYVWFVDSDDDIRPEAIEHFMSVRQEGYDFLDYDIELAGPRNTMGLERGEYTASQQLRAYLLGGNYGALCTKITRRGFLIENGIWYPEYCYFEDNMLSFVLPFYAKKFFKADLVGYEQFIDFDSVTRGSLNPRFYDRLHTAVLGFKTASALVNSQEERLALENRFIDLFAIKTHRQIMRKSRSRFGLVSSLRNREFREFLRRLHAHVTFRPLTRGRVSSARVMRYYREVARELKMHNSPLFRAEDLEARHRVEFKRLWVFSYFLASQRRHFDHVRKRAWPEPNAAGSSDMLPITE